MNINHEKIKCVLMRISTIRAESARLELELLDLLGEDAGVASLQLVIVPSEVSQRIATIKALRGITYLGLKEAKEAVESVLYRQVPFDLGVRTMDSTQALLDLGCTVTRACAAPMPAE